MLQCTELNAQMFRRLPYSEDYSARTYEHANVEITDIGNQLPATGAYLKVRQLAHLVHAVKVSVHVLLHSLHAVL